MPNVLNEPKLIDSLSTSCGNLGRVLLGPRGIISFFFLDLILALSVLGTFDKELSHVVAIGHF